jgi:Golgi apparatus protein 1
VVPHQDSSSAGAYLATPGNISRHVLEQSDEDAGLSTEHVVVIATLSTAVPILVLIAAVVVMCMKRRRKREQQRSDEEARMQNERNAVHSSMTKRSGSATVHGDTHMIKNTWGKCVNNVLAAGDEGGGGSVVSVCADLSNGSDLCFPKQQQQQQQQVAENSGPVYTLQRTRSHKQLNTDVHRGSQSNRTSTALLASKLDKDFDNLCPSNTQQQQRTPSSNVADKRISILSVDSSLCNAR